MKVPTGGGTPTTLASGQSTPGIAVDTTSVYWTNSHRGTVMKVPTGGGTAHHTRLRAELPIEHRR